MRWGKSPIFRVRRTGLILFHGTKLSVRNAPSGSKNRITFFVWRPCRGTNFRCLKKNLRNFKMCPVEMARRERWDLWEPSGEDLGEDTEIETDEETGD